MYLINGFWIRWKNNPYFISSFHFTGPLTLLSAHIHNRNLRKQKPNSGVSQEMANITASRDWSVYMNSLKFTNL